MSKEEQTILWQCVAVIPELYRVPLVLFYREDQSIERVAEALELSEDAVKQRLARGRKLLQEKALAYVEGALHRTKPGHALTIGVLAAVPLSAISTKAATAGAAVKGSSTAKTVVSLGALGAIFLYWSVIGFLAFVGCCVGYWMSRACVRSSRQCENGIRFWRTLALGFAVCIVIPQLLYTCGMMGMMGQHFIPWAGQHSQFVWWEGPRLFYTLAVAALAIWVRRWWLELPCKAADTAEPGRVQKRRQFVWLSLGTLAGVFAACIVLPQLLYGWGMMGHHFIPWVAQYTQYNHSIWWEGSRLFYTLAVAALAIWVRRRWRELPCKAADLRAGEKTTYFRFRSAKNHHGAQRCRL